MAYNERKQMRRRGERTPSSASCRGGVYLRPHTLRCTPKRLLRAAAATKRHRLASRKKRLHAGVTVRLNSSGFIPRQCAHEVNCAMNCRSQDSWGGIVPAESWRSDESVGFRFAAAGQSKCHGKLACIANRPRVMSHGDDIRLSGDRGGICGSPPRGCRHQVSRSRTEGKCRAAAVAPNVRGAHLYSSRCREEATRG